MRTRRLSLRLLSSYLARRGYVRDGNHVFSSPAFMAVCRGLWRASVIETPHAHPAPIVRAAALVSRLY